MSLRCPQLKAWDAVWFHNPQCKKGLTPKLQRPWQRPYIVTKRINDLVYWIQLRPSTKPKVVHRNRLWLYSGDYPPFWFQGPQSQIDSSAIQSNADDDEYRLSDDHDHSCLDDREQTPLEVHKQQLQFGLEQRSISLRRSKRLRRPPDRFEPT